MQIVSFSPENRIWHLMQIVSSGDKDLTSAWNAESCFLENMPSVLIFV